MAWMGMRWRWAEVGNDRGGAVPVPVAVAIGGGWWNTVGIIIVFLMSEVERQALLRAEPGVATVWTLVGLLYARNLVHS